MRRAPGQSTSTSGAGGKDEGTRSQNRKDRVVGEGGRKGVTGIDSRGPARFWFRKTTPDRPPMVLIHRRDEETLNLLPRESMSATEESVKVNLRSNDPRAREKSNKKGSIFYYFDLINHSLSRPPATR
jgi:hypothetical protein